MDFTTSPSQFIFPVLKSADILLCMSELEIDLSKAEISEPHRHKDKIKKVFLILLDTCAGIQEPDLESPQAVQDKVASVKYSELHGEGISDIKFFIALRKCLRTCGVYDFSWKDLHAPTAKRLRWQLSAIINLAKFREDQLPIYAELNEPRNEFLQSLAEVNTEHEQLVSQLEEVRATSETDYSAMEAVEKECEDLTVQIAHSNKLQAAKREEAAALKRKANDLKDELATATWALEEADAEEERLRSQVVSSPDRRQRDLNAKRGALDREREECENVETQLQNTKTMCRHVGEAIKAMHTEVATVDDVKEEAGKYSKVAELLETTNHEFEASKKQVTEISEKIVLAERDLNRSEEKLTNLQKQSKSKMEVAQASLGKAKALMHSVEKDRQDGMQRIEDGSIRVREIETQIEDDRIQAQEDIQAMISEYRETEELVMARLDKRMEAINATN